MASGIAGVETGFQLVAVRPTVSIRVLQLDTFQYIDRKLVGQVLRLMAAARRLAERLPHQRRVLAQLGRQRSAERRQVRIAGRHRHRGSADPLEVEQMPREQAEAQRARLLAWAGELALETEFETEEGNLLRQPVGTLQQQALINATWGLEGLGVLAWALSKFELPPYDQLVDAGVLLPSVGFLDLNKATASLASATLRSDEELQMRALIVPELRKRYPSGRIIHELPLRYSTSRIDLAAVTEAVGASLSGTVSEPPELELGPIAAVVEGSS